MPRKRSCFLAILESMFSDFFAFFFFQRFIITATTSAISKFLPKWAHVAQHKLNEYSTSRNNLSTSPTLIQYFVEQQMLNRVSLTLVARS